jgi:hypothetical protein
MVPEQDDGITTAVMLGKIEVRLDQVLCILAEHGRSFDEAWSRLRKVEEEQAANRQWRASVDARRAPWWTIVSTIIGVAGFLLAAGLIGARGI